MDRKDVLKRLLYPKCKSAIEFQFDSLRANPLLCYITIEDIVQLNKIATSIKYSSKPKEKYAMIDKILVPRGFKKMASGTNRVTYRFLNDYSIVLKVAIDKVGLSDNGNEYRNQNLLKPFVTKCFEVSPCGTVGLFERVVPITSREEFENIADDVFDLINNLIGKYVLEDIGEKFYMNYGLREGFGPVLLDYPYVFELDGRKLICNVVDPLEPLGYCGGEIDYDLGYNDLVCKKCGKRYLATELKSDEKTDKPKIIVKGEDIIMKCVLKRGDEVISVLNSEDPVSVNTIPSRNNYDRMRGKISKGNNQENNKKYKPTIKTSDEVGFKCRLKGYPKGKNIDREAIKQDERLERNTPKIQVSFNEEEVIENVNLKADLKLNNAIVKAENNDKNFLKKVDEIDKEILPEVEEVKPESTDSLFETIDRMESEVASNIQEILIGDRFRAEFRGNEIWDIDSNELVGYVYLDNTDNQSSHNTIYESHEDSEIKYDEPSYEYVEGYVTSASEIEENVVESKDDEIPSETDQDYYDSESDDDEDYDEQEDESYEEEADYIQCSDYKSESIGVSLGDLFPDKFKSFNQNDNYKTEKIVSPVPNHFAAKQSNSPKIKQEELDKLSDF